MVVFGKVVEEAVSVWSLSLVVVQSVVSSDGRIHSPGYMLTQGQARSKSKVFCSPRSHSFVVPLFAVCWGPMLLMPLRRDVCLSLPAPLPFVHFGPLFADKEKAGSSSKTRKDRDRSSKKSSSSSKASKEKKKKSRG